ncbi:hypothetical protein NT06LI_0815 [Listeria innocua FSL J1-023]|nr:hypothetical protein NT06LI_0815 [Listeria innocua FSL J1-023]
MVFFIIITPFIYHTIKKAKDALCISKKRVFYFLICSFV